MRQVIEIEKDGVLYELVPNFRNVHRIESRLKKGLFIVFKDVIESNGQSFTLEELNLILTACVKETNVITEDFIFENRIKLSEKVIEFIGECLKSPNLGEAIDDNSSKKN